MRQRPLPVGVDQFESLIQKGSYYVDKTLLIKELLDKKAQVTLFTRPRRFGKTLNMSMLQYFFEDTGDDGKNERNRSLFQGLRIMDAGKEYFSEMTAHPVISLTLKSAKQSSFSSSYFKICEELAREFDRHSYVLEGLSGIKRERYLQILEQKASTDICSGALRFLSEVLENYYKKTVIILVDEYDVPLENAYFAGFYEEMSAFVRALFEAALKTNPSLDFAVITGCLRISRESIFTGLNNLSVMSVLSSQYDEYFGFTKEETQKLLRDYGLERYSRIVEKWYDGYLFGETTVYNPWSVISFAADALAGGEVLPRPYWSNTSSNSIVRDLVERADVSAREELETLAAGGAIEKPIHEDITYDTMYDAGENLWNFLFFTGYLKLVSKRMEGRELTAALAIPNEEVAYIFDHTVRSWFRDKIRSKDLTVLYRAMLEGDAGAFEEELAGLLQESISYMDSREAFYHGFLMGVLGNLRDYLVKSNRESGNGRLDICVRSLNVKIPPVILELKTADTFRQMEEACEAALGQIEEMGYGSELAEEGYEAVREYGIAFYRKQCKVKGRLKKLV